MLGLGLGLPNMIHLGGDLLISLDEFEAGWIHLLFLNPVCKQARDARK